MVGAALRVAFFGTPQFAVPTLDALLASHHRMTGVITQPDRPRGRGQRLAASPVKDRARRAGLPVLQPAVLRSTEFLEAFAELRADVGVVAAYGRILPSALIDAPRLGMINVHASLLPRLRGAAPIQRAVLAGDTETGVTIMRIVEALDAGPVLASERRAIGPDETSVEVERDLALLGARVLVDILDRLADGPVDERPQDEGAATYAPRVTKEEGLVDWSRPGRAIHNQIRGLHPWPHARTFCEGHQLILHRSRPAEVWEPGPPGTVVMARADSLIVAAGEGAVHLLEVQPEGRRPMSIRDFLAGHRVQPGVRLSSTPAP